jgi:DNA-directed RNA polymerase alpha subunit
VSSSAKKVGQPVHLSDFFSSKRFNEKFPRRYPWLSIGFPSNSVERVGFRVECVDPSDQEDEIFFFEILTNGAISPRSALHEAALVLIRKFSAIANVTLPIDYCLDSDRKSFRKEFSSFFDKKDVRHYERPGQTLYSIFDTGFSAFQEPLGLDLRNLTLSKERYSEFQNLGFQTLGQLLERLASDFYSFPYSLERQRRQAFFRLGISSLFDFL